MTTTHSPARVAVAVATVGFALLLAACGSSRPDSAGGDGSGSAAAPVTVTFADGVDLESPNPYAHSSSTSYGKWGHVIEPLVRWNYDTLQFDPVLAVSWELEDDVTWRFDLRPDVVFQDGTPFTAEDVVHSFTRMVEDPESRQGANFDAITDMEVVDDLTLRVTTDGPYPILLNDLNSRYITSAEAYEELGPEEADRQLVGTGPYKFVEWVPGSRLVLSKFDDYWGEEPLPDEVIFRPIPEDAARVAALERGEVDVISNVPPQDASRIEATDSLELLTVPSVRMAFFPINPAIEPFDDVRVRQAINYAIDRQTLLDTVLEGFGDLLPGPLQSNIFGYSPDWEPYPYDPDRARELLAEAGYADGVDVTLYSPSGRYLRDLELSQAVAGQLADVGINAEVETMEWGTFADRYDSGEFGFYLIGRGGIVDGADVLVQYFQTGVTSRIDYSNPEVDALLEASNVELDPDAREELIQQAGALILEDAPAVFFLTYEDIYAVSDGIVWTPRSDEYVLATDVEAVNR